MARRARPQTSPICTRGPRPICPARAGSGSIPTSGLLAGEGHIPLACTPHPVSAAPITGAIEECDTTFEHTMSVRRVVESPRVTKPYSDEQWQSIDAFGKRIERQLTVDDVRITIGGEPTFVASDDPDAPSGTRPQAGRRSARSRRASFSDLRARFAPQGMLHYGQGKWYPGEQLPRWAFSLYLAARRQAGLDRRHVDRRRRTRTTASPPNRPASSRQGVARRLELSTAARSCRRTRILGTSSVRNASCPRISIRRANRLEDPMARTRLARVFERG